MGERRASSLSPPEFYLLTAWGRDLYETFGSMPYLVGSCARGEQYRDVDVRMLLDPEKDPMHSITLPGRKHTLLGMNTAISVWGQKVTGLPIDFQFQDCETANAEHGGETRNPIGYHGAERFPRADR